MSSDQHRRVKGLFLQACELAAGERAAFLEQACGGDLVLRREVESLLRFHVEEASVGDEARAIRAIPPELELPATIGRFILLQKLGEGGMGEVYEAEQQGPVRRRVALKIIKWGMDTKEVVARFESERQALALMDHPNIARVFEAGSTEQGRPYFVMECVDGIPITDYCDANRLEPADRLRLFLQVCEAVQHAHQKGIIHRDIKPSNILVTLQDGRPVPKIIDFGVAKAISQRLTERTVFTRLGQWIGTPEYMSPEQAGLAGLDVDTRTDVYSLGVVLYELLAGAQPFDSTALREAGFDEMRRRIREVEPPRPSTRVTGLGPSSQTAAERRRTDVPGLVRQLRGDLDWITMRALEKDRTRRYASPAELAADIGRHLHNQPVQASPPSVAYRVGKFVRRHRLGVAATATVLLALLAGIVGTSIGLVRAQREAETARQVMYLLRGMFWTMGPGAPVTHTGSVRDLLQYGWERIDNDLSDKPLAEAELKSILGEVYLALGDHEEASSLLERALELRLRELGPKHRAVGDSLNALGVLRLNTGEFEDAAVLFERALSTFEGTIGVDNVTAANVFVNLGAAKWRLAEYDTAVELCDRAIGILERKDRDGQLNLASALSVKATVYRELMRTEESLVLDERCLAIREGALGPEHTAVGWALFLIGLDRYYLDDTGQARADVERALEIQRAALGPNSYPASAALQLLGEIEWREGHLEAARRDLEEALAIREGALGTEHPDLVWVLRPLGHVLRETGEREAGRRMLERALAIAEASFGPRHFEVSQSLVALGYDEYRLGNYAAARELYERALEIRRSAFGPGHRWVGRTSYNLACIAAVTGDRNEAIADLRWTLDTDWRWAGALDDPDLDSLRGDPEADAILAELARQPSPE